MSCAGKNRRQCMRRSNRAHALLRRSPSSVPGAPCTDSAAVTPYNPRPPTIWRRAPGRVLPAMKSYMCVICGYVYEEEKGDPVSGIAPGTRWDDVPLSWRCPDCGAGKEDFEMVEV